MVGLEVYPSTKFDLSTFANGKVRTLLDMEMNKSRATQHESPDARADLRWEIFERSGGFVGLGCDLWVGCEVVCESRNVLA